MIKGHNNMDKEETENDVNIPGPVLKLNEPKEDHSGDIFAIIGFGILTLSVLIPAIRILVIEWGTVFR